MDVLAQIFKKKQSGDQQKQKQQPISNIYLERLSQILQGNQTKPHLLFIKSTILIIVLCLVVYHIYNLFQDFKNQMVIAFLSGIACKQMRLKFISMFQKTQLWPQEKKIKQKQQKNSKSIIKIVGIFLLFILLPWIRRYAKMSFTEHQMLNINRVFQSFFNSTNIVIRIAQLYLLILLVKQLFGQKIKDRFSYKKLSSQQRKRLGICFYFIFALVIIFLVAFFPIVLVNQTTRLINFSIKTFQTKMDCQISPNQTENYFSKRPCSEIISNNILANLTKISNQTQLKINVCVKALDGYKTYFRFIQKDYVDYIQTICFLKEKMQQISPNYLSSVSLEDTTNIIYHIFILIINLGNNISNFIYSIFIFIAIFSLTVKYFDFNSNKLKILGAKRNDIILSITGIISASIFIAIEHLIYGIFVFQIFRFSNINILISILLSMVAFVPMVTPHFVMIMISLINYFITGNLISCAICCGYYYWMSGRVYDRNYNKVQVNKVFINLSVIFGIYKYGISGIIYGPLLILLFLFVYQQLFPSPEEKSQE